MSRQSISFTEPNRVWLKQKVEAEGEYKSNSELVNELIRKARAREDADLRSVHAALAEGEQSGISAHTPDDIMNAVIARKRSDGAV